MYRTTTSDGEAQPSEFAKYSTTTTGDDEPRPPEPAKYGAVTADDTAVAKTDARPLEIAKCRDKAVKPTIKESVGEKGLLRVHGTVQQQSQSPLAMV